MIRYALRCREGHEFDSWFRAAEGYEALRASGHVCCPVCGTIEVEKALMAPQVQTARKAAARAAGEGEPCAAGIAAAPGACGAASPTARAQAEMRRAALAELRRRIESSSEYVGLRFAAEARRIHAGEAPERQIHGEARLEDARALLEEGVPVAPLPFFPGKVN